MYRVIILSSLLAAALHGGCVTDGDRGAEETGRGWRRAFTREWRIPARKSFIVRYELTDPSEAGRTVTLPLRNIATAPDFTVDWGDGSPVSVVKSSEAPERIHVYASTGVKTVRMRGRVSGWSVDNNPTKGLNTVKEFVSWGPTDGISGYGLEHAFYGCVNLTSLPDFMPPFTITTLDEAWVNCRKMTRGGRAINCPGVTSLLNTWLSCNALLAAPDVSGLTNVTTLSGTWNGCSNLVSASPVSALTKVTTLSSTWKDCAALVRAPYVNTLTNVTSLYKTWDSCGAMVHASPVNNLVKCGSSGLASTWYGCASLIVAPDVNTLTNVTTLQYTWRRCFSLREASAVSNLWKVTNLGGSWGDCMSLEDAPEVNALTNLTTITGAWAGCSNLLRAVSITNLLKVTNISGAWGGCKSITNSVQDILGDPLMNLSQLSLSKEAFSGCEKLSGQGLPFVNAALGGLFKNTYTIGTNTTHSSYRTFYNCTNLSDYAEIPAEFK